MPISRMMPIRAMTLNSRPAKDQRQQRADAGGRQGRENRYRMNVTFIEHAQNDVDGDQRGENQKRLVRQGNAKGLRGALKAGLDACRQAKTLPGIFYGLHRLAERSAGCQIEGDVDDGKLTLMVDRQWRVGALHLTESAQRHRAAGARLHVEIIEIVGGSLKVGFYFHDDAILIQLGKDRRDLALAESVIERVVKSLRVDAETRSGIAVNHEPDAESLVGLIAGDIAQFGPRL